MKKESEHLSMLQMWYNEGVSLSQQRGLIVMWVLLQHMLVSEPGWHSDNLLVVLSDGRRLISAETRLKVLQTFLSPAAAMGTPCLSQEGYL